MFYQVHMGLTIWKRWKLIKPSSKSCPVAQEKVFIKRFYSEDLHFKREVNMFLHIEITEPIYEGEFETYKRTREYYNHSVHTLCPQYEQYRKIRLCKQPTPRRATMHVMQDSQVSSVRTVAWYMAKSINSRTIELWANSKKMVGLMDT